MCSILPPPQSHPYSTPTLPCLHSCSIPPLYLLHTHLRLRSLIIFGLGLLTHSVFCLEELWHIIGFIWNLEEKDCFIFATFAIKFGVFVIINKFENNNNTTTIKGTTIFPRPRKKISLKTIFPVFQKKMYRRYNYFLSHQTSIVRFFFCKYL